MPEPHDETAADAEPSRDGAPGVGGAADAADAAPRLPDAAPRLPDAAPRLPAVPLPRARVARRPARPAAGPVRETLIRLARNPAVVTSAVVGAGLALRLGPAVVTRELLARTAAGSRPAPARQVDVLHVVHHHVVHHVVHHVHHVHHVVQSRPLPPLPR